MLDKATIASVDIGYGFTKATDGFMSVVFPSVAGDVVQADFDNDVVRAGSGKAITLDGRGWIYGKNSLHQSRNPLTLFARERVEQRDLMRLLFAAAMVELDISGRVKICTGLPIDWYGDKDTLQSLLLGAYDLDVDGKSWPLHVCQVVIVPQPFGSFFDLALDDRGQVINAAFVKGKVGILDIGTYTTDYALSDGLEYIVKASGSKTAAMSTVWRQVRDEIQKAHGIEYDLHDIDGFMRNDCTIVVEGRTRSIQPFVETAIGSLASQVLAGARERWGKARDFTRILITGGGGAYVEAHVKATYGHAQTVPQPHMGNLRGFYKYALRKFG